MKKKRCQHKNIVPVKFVKQYVFPSHSHSPVQECYGAEEFLCLDCRTIMRNVSQAGVIGDNCSEEELSKLTTK